MQPLLSDAMLASNSTNPPDDVKPKQPIDNKIRGAWNDYVSFLDKKGMKGNPILDHNDNGFKMLEQYRKENPDTPLTKEMIVPIQQDFSNYRNYEISKIKAGKLNYAPGTDENNFMKSLSIVDGIPGQRTSSYSFPSSYMSTFNNDKLVKKENVGFSTAQNQ